MAAKRLGIVACGVILVVAVFSGAVFIDVLRGTGCDGGVSTGFCAESSGSFDENLGLFLPPIVTAVAVAACVWRGRYWWLVVVAVVMLPFGLIFPGLV